MAHHRATGFDRSGSQAMMGWMKSYAVPSRGISVGGRNIVPIADLRK
jgi:hypothetical protein